MDAWSVVLMVLGWWGGGFTHPPAPEVPTPAPEIESTLSDRLRHAQLSSRWIEQSV